jgi:hypothetical protein
MAWVSVAKWGLYPTDAKPGINLSSPALVSATDPDTCRSSPPPSGRREIVPNAIPALAMACIFGIGLSAGVRGVVEGHRDTSCVRSRMWGRSWPPGPLGGQVVTDVVYHGTCEPPAAFMGPIGLDRVSGCPSPWRAGYGEGASGHVGERSTGCRASGAPQKDRRTGSDASTAQVISRLCAAVIALPQPVLRRTLNSASIGHIGE